MSSFADIERGYKTFNDNKSGGLVYTQNCGWIDLGHMRPGGATNLWNRLKAGGSDTRVRCGQHAMHHLECYDLVEIDILVAFVDLQMEAKGFLSLIVKQ